MICRNYLMSREVISTVRTLPVYPIPRALHPCPAHNSTPAPAQVQVPAVAAPGREVFGDPLAEPRKARFPDMRKGVFCYVTGAILCFRRQLGTATHHPVCPDAAREDPDPAEEEIVTVDGCVVQVAQVPEVLAEDNRKPALHLCTGKVKERPEALFPTKRERCCFLPSRSA